MAAAEEGGSLLFAALVTVDVEAALVTVEEEAALGLENMVAVEEEGAVAVLVTAEEEGVVAALVDVEVWFGTPKSSVRRLLVRLLVDMVRGNFLLLLGMFRKQLWKQLWKKINTPGALTSTMQATKMRRARSFLYSGP